MTTSAHAIRRPGLSLMELVAATTIIGILSALVVVRVSGALETASSCSCAALAGEIEIQSQLWFRNNGSFPAANLSDIGTDLSHFPEGLPLCPEDGSNYTIDPSTGRVVGHNH